MPLVGVVEIIRIQAKKAADNLGLVVSTGS
jgi:hypothetical protein